MDEQSWDRWSDTVRITPLDVNAPYTGNGYHPHAEPVQDEVQWQDMPSEPAQKPVDALLHRTLIASLVLLVWAALVLLVLVMLGVIHPLAPYEGSLGL